MPTAIGRDELKRKLENDPGLTVIETLDPEYFQEYHLPGAINIPPGPNFAQQIEMTVRDKQQPVVVYCMNRQCTASTKAAEEMEQLGYRNVYDYEGGKEDWREADYEVEMGGVR